MWLDFSEASACITRDSELNFVYQEPVNWKKNFTRTFGNIVILNVWNYHYQETGVLRFWSPARALEQRFFDRSRVSRLVLWEKFSHSMLCENFFFPRISKEKCRPPVWTTRSVTALQAIITVTEQCVNLNNTLLSRGFKHADSSHTDAFLHKTSLPAL